MYIEEKNREYKACLTLFFFVLNEQDMKRQTLLELVDYVNTPAGQKIFTESVMSDLMAMVSANVCRALPPATDDFDPEEDEPVLEPAWPHLQVAYEFFLRFIVSSEVNAKAAKKYVDQRFCLQLVELFDSEDPRERDYLKTILHRIYGKFMSHRSFIRRAISNVFYRFVYETERHNGIGELLEILEHASNPEEFLEHTKLEMFKDQVFAFTPRGELISLPAGATPVDFAYAVHSEIGDRCVGSKTNGRMMPLRTTHRNGDQVEIVTSKAQTPSPTWDRFVVSGKARARIRRFVRLQERDQYHALGRSILQLAFKESGNDMTDKGLNGILKSFSQPTIEDLCAQIGAGHITAKAVVEDGREVVAKADKHEEQALFDAFVNAALYAQKTGFDGIELHGAHGYLLDSFMRYGRLEYVCDLLRAMREKLGADYPIALRFSQWRVGAFDDRQFHTLQELEKALLALQKAGVDIFHASTRRFWLPEFDGSDLNLAGWTRKITGAPTITVGNIGLVTEEFCGTGPESARELQRRYERGDFDMVAIGRPLLSDAEWCNKIRDDRSGEIVDYTPAANKIYP